MKFEDVYEVKELLGKGSFAEVKKCINRKTSQLFAVKEVDYQNAEDREQVENESEILERLDHLSIVRLEEVFYADGKVLIVLEYLPGGDLFDGLVSRSSYSEKDACACAWQIISALDYLSRKGVIHRDLKPENLLLAEKPSEDRPPIIKLADFGIARMVEDGRNVVKCHGSGSPMYMAPETVLESPVGFAVDMWACGVILYLLLVGYPPFWNEKVEFLLLSILQGNYTFPSPYWDTVSESAKDLISKMLTVDPNDRLTASRALQHHWIAQGDFVPSLHGRTTLVRLTAFNARRKLKGVVLGLIARKRCPFFICVITNWLLVFLVLGDWLWRKLGLPTDKTDRRHDPERLTFTPSKNVVRLTRRESYTPDQDLESKVQELLSSKESEEQHRLPKIDEGGNENCGHLSSSREFRVDDIKPRRSRTFRSSLYIKVKAGEETCRQRMRRKASNEDT